ncbi:MAG TPA: GGDEF domain-containing protein [Polyangia bacterium]|jgi:diguanylate cyclase (GGDEF)-like protein|nr:GGDEF domain-containing protein [Polyangia bacterium]
MTADDTTLERRPIIEPPVMPRGPSAYLLVIAGPSFGEMHRLQGTRSVIGRADTAAVRVLDDGISREHAAVERDGGKNVLVDLGSTNGTFCNGERIDKRRDLVDGDKVSVGASTILKFTYQDQVDERYQKRLFESALRDGLTATFNRRYFVDRLNTEMRFASRHDKSLALLFVDIDHFKKINDGFGHQTGDYVLAAVAREMIASLRAEDVLARYGGEEFAIICREIEKEGALALGERLRAGVARARFEHEGRVIPVTVSVGAAVARKPQQAQPLIAAADAAMYEAKRAGRNRVSFHD